MKRGSTMDSFVQTSVDRHTAHRIVPMRCLALGMPRTGTNSLHTALKILGFNECYHQVTLIQNPQDAVMWMKALQFRNTEKAFGRPEWDALLGHCQAACDLPVVHFSKELMEAYPEAKVILTSRNAEQWHYSMCQTLERRYNSRFIYLLSFLDRTTWLWASVFYRGWDELFDGQFKFTGIEFYNDYNESIRKQVEPGRLLEYHPSQGWEPLCEFLGVPIPGTTFPAGNNGEEFHAACKTLDNARLRAVMWRGVVIGFCLVVGLSVRYKLAYEG